MRSKNEKSERTDVLTRVARLTQDQGVRRRPSTRPQFLKNFQKGAQGGAGRRGGRRREGDKCNPAGSVRTTERLPRALPLRAIPVNNTGLTLTVSPIAETRSEHVLGGVRVVSR
jgi:hypothetical protein